MNTSEASLVSHGRKVPFSLKECLWHLPVSISVLSYSFCAGWDQIDGRLAATVKSPWFPGEKALLTWALGERMEMHNVLKCGNCSLGVVKCNPLWEQLKEYYKRFIVGLETRVNVMNISSAQCLWRRRYWPFGWSPRGALNGRARRGVWGLASVMSAPRKIPSIYSTVHQTKANTRRSLRSVIEPDYLGWIIYGKRWIPA